MDHALLHHPQLCPALPEWLRSSLVSVARPLLQAPLFALLDRVAPAEVTGRHSLAEVETVAAEAGFVQIGSPCERHGLFGITVCRKPEEDVLADS